MGRVFMDLDTGVMYPDEMYKNLCRLRGLTGLAYEEHVRHIIKESEAASDKAGLALITEAAETKWEDTGPFNKERMLECLDNIFGNYEGMPNILKESAKDLRKTLLSHFKENDDDNDD